MSEHENISQKDTGATGSPQRSQQKPSQTSFPKNRKFKPKGGFQKKKPFKGKKGFPKGKGYRKKKKSRSRKPQLKPEIKEKVNQLMEKNGLTFRFALQVATGKKKLAQALKEMLHHQKIEHLAKKHKISKALAGQVAVKKLTLEKAIQIEKFDKIRKKFVALSCFSESAKKKALFVLHCHGDKILRGVVKKNDKYDIDWLEEGAEEIIRMPKLEVKFAYPKELEEKVMPLLQVDEEVKKRGLGPIKRVVERYRIKDNLLRDYMFSPQKIKFTTLEGDVLVGKVVWFNLYEIFLELEKEVGVYLLRHCLYQWEKLEN